jgi:hypothetical protein
MNSLTDLIQQLKRVKRKYYLQVSDFEGLDPLVLGLVLGVRPPEESVFLGQTEKWAGLRISIVHLLFGVVAYDENSICRVLC